MKGVNWSIVEKLQAVIVCLGITVTAGEDRCRVYTLYLDRDNCEEGSNPASRLLATVL